MVSGGERPAGAVKELEQGRFCDFRHLYFYIVSSWYKQKKKLFFFAYTPQFAFPRTVWCSLQYFDVRFYYIFQIFKDFGIHLYVSCHSVSEYRGGYQSITHRGKQMKN